MKKEFLTNFILVGFVIFLGVFLFGQAAQAGVVQFGNKNIFVDFDGLPFNLNNWAPGMSSSPKTITITNHENFDINVYFGAQSTSSDQSLGNVLTVKVDSQAKHLTDLFAHRIFLGSVKAKTSQSYNISLSFDSDAGNQYQNKTIKFDFVIVAAQIGGSQGTQTVIIPGGGGGAVNIMSLAISNENVSSTSNNSAVITWQTNDFATSRVVYDTVSHPSLGNSPNYGYAFSTPENLKKVTVHKIVLTNLLPGTTYYYRCVSRGSLAISSELTFTTAGQSKKGAQPAVNQPSGQTNNQTVGPVAQPTGPQGQAGQGAGGQNVIPKTTSLPSTKAIAGGGGGVKIVGLPTKTPAGVGGSMLAALGNITKSKALLAFVIILLLTLLYFFIKELILLFTKRRRKKKASS